MGNLAAAIIARPTTRRRFVGVLNLVLGSLAVSYAMPVGRTRAAEQAAGKWVCTNADCDPFVYDPAVGDVDNIAHPGHPIPPGLAFEDLPHDWTCPLCGSGKRFFRPLDA